MYIGSVAALPQFRISVMHSQVKIKEKKKSNY